MSKVGSVSQQQTCRFDTSQMDRQELQLESLANTDGDPLGIMFTKLDPRDLCNVGGGFKKTFKKTQTRGKIFTHFDDIIFEMLQKLTIQ